MSQHVWKKIGLSIITLIILFVIAVLLLLSTDWGNRIIFTRLLNQQQLMSYEYKGGNIWKGVRLDNFHLTVDDTQIKVDTATLHLGWRSLLFTKEAHFFQADLNTLEIINTAPSDGTPFTYPDIAIPLNLRFNELNAKQLQIKTATHTTYLHDIQLNDTLWKGTHLSFEQSKVNLYGVFIENATGFIDFKQQGQYPLQLDATVELPSLHSINIHKISAHANGSLARINGGVATNTPDLLTGWIVVQPMDDNVPMQGAINFKDYHLPFLTEEKLFAKDGIARFNGNADGFHIELNTDLKGKHVPQGQYTSQMYTDFVNQLNIQNFVGDVMNGQVQLAGVLDWQNTDNVKWTAQGVFDHLKVPTALLSADIQGFLPAQLTGQIQSQGSLKDGVVTQNKLQFSNNEHWSVDYQQIHNKTPLLNLAWQNINREMPYITGLNSPNGQAQIQLKDKNQIIDVKTVLKPFADSFLAEGQYDAQLVVQDNRLDIPKLNYQLGDSRLTATGQVLLPHAKQALNWVAKVQTHQFNPQLVNANIPVNLLTGSFDVNGYAKDETTQIIHTKNMNLTGHLANQLQSDMAETVKLTGDSTTAILFEDAKKGGAFKGYAVQYDGHFTAVNTQNHTADGKLQVKLAGTPDYLEIERLYHDGIAGQIDAKGHLNLVNGVQWDIHSNLLNFKPHYFYSAVNGNISGIIKTKGEWSDHNKKIDIEQLNLAGTLNNKSLRGTGQLSVNLNHLDKGLKYQQFNANQLTLIYAQNQMQVTGDQNQMLMRVNAPALYEIYSSLKGKIYGDLVLSRQQRLQLNSNLIVDNFAYDDVVMVEKMKLQGELPISDEIPSQLVLTVQNANLGSRQIKQATANLTGTYLSHVLKIDSQQPRSKFYMQIAGGINNHRQWLGQIQKGYFQSPRMKLEQNRNADVVYHLDKKTLSVAKHCWNNGNNQLCFDHNIFVSPEQANISVMTKNIYIQDLEAFIPDGLEITGQLNGYAKMDWKKGQSPQLDAQLFTKNGVIGLMGEQPNEEGTVLAYDDLSLIAKTTAQGLLIRSNMKTPSIGTGYANVLIKPEIKGMPMTGEVAFEQVQLEVLRPFIDDVRQMSGTLSVAGKIDGTLTKPEFYGDLRLKNGVFSLNTLPVDLNNIELYMGIRQDTALINGTFYSGQGLATLAGKAAWGQQPYLRLKLKGDNLLIRQAPQIMAAANTDMNLEILPMQKRISVDGKIHIPRALINMPESSAEVVEVSPDVRVVRSNQAQIATLTRAKAWDINANIGLSLGNQIIFQGFDARIPLTGKLDLTQKGTQIAMRAVGAIGSTRQVQISAYGQTLNLTRAIARFNGALVNPTLDINASKTIQGDIVGVRVLGTALSPNIQIYSDAGLSEQQALNALLTGSISDGTSASATSTESFKSDVNNAVAAAGISMGLGGTRALTNQIGRAFGLSGLSLDAQSSGSDTQVSLTGYITPDLYIRYGVGVFSPVNRLSLRYQINRRLYLEASQDTERAIDLFYNWRF